MSALKIKRVLVSVYDKTGVVEFTRNLLQMGIEIISTGGTAKLLQENNIPVTLVEEITGFPEMLDGRVKTTHPNILAAILADRDNPQHMRQLDGHGIKPIDMVVVNLYPFEETVADPNCSFEQAIEMIDIGGPCMLRAAAKNHQSIAVLSDNAQFDIILDLLKCNDRCIDQDTRLDLAAEVFDNTVFYDERIYAYLAHVAARRSDEPALPPRWGRLRLPIRRLAAGLRYGENPHQRSCAYTTYVMSPYKGVSIARQKPLGNVEMSHNNYVDADSALALCSELARELNDQPASVFVKHTNPCGVGIADDPIEAYRRAYLGNPPAAMGGVLAQNTKVDSHLATVVMESLDRWGKAVGAEAFFVEVWLAPEFDDQAIDIIKTKKKWGERVRLLAVGDMTVHPDDVEMDFKKIAGGILVQDRDLIGLNEDDWKVVGKRQPTEAEMADLRLAWLICKHTKSNAITVCKDGMLLGSGAGQTSRVMSCRLATWLARENNHEKQLDGSAAASDAFFPFRDGPDLLIKAGVRAIIQPGGSKRDEETIAACDDNDVAMIFTGTRHFKH